MWNSQIGIAGADPEGLGPGSARNELVQRNAMKTWEVKHAGRMTFSGDARADPRWRPSLPRELRRCVRWSFTS